MNIFILNTGRCGSTTFIKACQHIDNYTASHESRSKYVGESRLSYPINHIEADNRLSWFLGRLENIYGNNALYVHLKRERLNAIESFSKREHFGIMQAYRDGILMGGSDNLSKYDLAADYIDTVESNIEHFLTNKRNKMDFHLENAKNDFILFFDLIGAEGNINNSLSEWDINYNASP
ncbi:MAG: hypothetical protein GY934_11000 [Gammaproteobacteria bacterium]|nr:hypothetical protein [Gammaproteobacteria bacterium]